MEIKLAKADTTAAFVSTLDRLAEAFEGDLVVSKSGHDTLTFEKATFSGRVWSWLKEDPNSKKNQAEVHSLINSFLFANKEHFENHLKTSGTPSVKKYSKFVTKELLEQIEEKPVIFTTSSEIKIKANKIFFARFPFFTNSTSGIFKKDLPILLSDYSPDVIQHFVEVVYGLTSLESLPLDKWIEFYALADYLGIDYLKNEVVEALLRGLGSRPGDFMVPFIEWAISYPDAAHYINPIMECVKKFRPETSLILCEILRALPLPQKKEPCISFLLGWIYSQGCEEKRSLPKAFRWYKKAADQGVAQAEIIVAHLYYTGEGVKPNPLMAFKYYEKAAQKGSSEGLLMLGNLYFFGKGVPKDLPKALECFNASAEQGNSRAQFDLAVLYFKGREVVQDLPKALAYYTLAAEGGNALAQYNLGLIYIQGKYVDKDVVLGEALITKAAKQNLPIAIDFCIKRFLPY